MYGMGFASRVKVRKTTARLAAASLLAASGVMAMAGVATASGGGAAVAAPPGGGNNGTVQINGQDIKNGNDPHLTCPITIKWSGFDPAPTQDDYTVTFTGINPTGGTVSVLGGANPDSGTFTGPDFTKQYQLNITGGNANNKGEYHVNIEVMTKSAGGSETKSKTVWLGDCGPHTVSLSGSCNTRSGNFDWTLATSPSTPAVQGSYTPQGGAATNYTTTNSGTVLFSTGQVGTVAYTVSTPGWSLGTASPVTATANAACSAGGGTVTVTGACTSNSANSGYTWSVATTPAGGTVSGSWTPSGGGASTAWSSPSFTTGSGVNSITVALSTASTNAGWSLSGQPGAAPVDCSTAQTVVDPSATATSTCSAMSVHLDAGTHATTFDITEPGGVHHEVVGAGQTQNISYTPGAGLTVSVSAAGKNLASATAPSSCSNPGQAAPAASADNKCKSGINVTLSNLNGTADAVFTVTDPDGNAQDITVRSGQLKKVSYAVEEDTTGVVTVTAPGLAKQTFTYKKDCAAVLGVKHTRGPTHKPTKVPTKVEGEKSQLPFTGFNTRQAMFDGAALLLLGGMLCGLAGRREDKYQAKA